LTISYLGFIFDILLLQGWGQLEVDNFHSLFPIVFVDMFNGRCKLLVVALTDCVRVLSLGFPTFGVLEVTMFIHVQQRNV
jgi:hypothetical protein